MSFQVFLQAFDAGQPAGWPPAEIRRAFGDSLVELEEDFWQVAYGGESTDLFPQPVPGDPSRVHTLSVHRPCADPRLWEALYELLGRPGSLLHFPGCAAPLARDVHAAVAAMPPSWLDSPGRPHPAVDARALQLVMDNA